MSRSVSSFFITQEIISAEDREVYEYSFEVLFSTVMSLLAVVIIAILSRTVYYTALYLAGFIPLRLFAGGYHAKNHLRCFVALMIVYFAFTFTLRIIPAEFFMTIIIVSNLLSTLLVFLVAPSEEKKRPFTSEETVWFKRVSRTFIIVYVTLIGVLAAAIPDIRIAFSISMGVLTVSISLLVNYIKCMKLKKE